MKKIIGYLIVMALLPAAYMVGCSESTAPSSPRGFGTKTPTKTVTRTITLTRTITATPGETATALPSQANPAIVNLRTAANYVVLAYSEVTNSGPSTLCGSLGLYPLASVDGGIVIACGGVTDVANGAANIAKQDLNTAYTDAAGRTGGAILPAGGDVGGSTFYHGLYTCGGDLLLSSADLTLDGQGDSNAVFIIQVTGNLIVNPGRQVSLINSADAAKVFWQVTGYCSLDTTVAMVGNIMAYTSVTMNTGAVLVGRALAENGNVTLLTNTITKP